MNSSSFLLLTNLLALKREPTQRRSRPKDKFVFVNIFSRALFCRAHSNTGHPYARIMVNALNSMKKVKLSAKFTIWWPLKVAGRILGMPIFPWLLCPWIKYKIKQIHNFITHTTTTALSLTYIVRTASSLYKFFYQFQMLEHVQTKQKIALLLL